MRFIILLSVFLVSTVLQAKVEIKSYRHSSWNNEWNEFISNEISSTEGSVMLTNPIDTADLLELDCPGFNTAMDNDAKLDFWVVFFSALTRAESAFNVHAKSRAPKGGHGNYGLLQLSKSTARIQCGLKTPEEIADPSEHLRCGVKLLTWQLEGAPSSSGKLLRSDLKGQLFGKRILLWGPLRQNDKRGRATLVSWFKQHLNQLPLCKE